MFAWALSSAQAQNTVILTTYSDWTNYDNASGSITFQATTAVDLDGVTANGIDNANSGATDIGGALEVSPIVPCNWGQAGPTFNDHAVSSAVLAAIDPGAAYGSPTPAQSGTMYVDYTLPDNSIGGSGFAMGIFFQKNDQWGGGGQDWSPTDLGPVSTPSGTQEKYRARIPYTINADANNLSFFNIGFWIFTDRQGSNPWYIDNITVVPLVTITPPPITNLFTTYEDFSGWTSAGGDLVLSTNDWSSDIDVTNGLGNTTAAGATGTEGSLLINWSSVETSYGFVASSPNEDGNAAFMQAIDPGCDTGTQTSVPAYGNIYVDYSQPDNSGGGTYFGFAVALSYPANSYSGWGYSAFGAASTKDLNIQDASGYEVYRATIPYTIEAGSYSGFTFNIFANSDYQPTNGFHVDNILVSAASAPAITSVGLTGSNLIIQGTNGLGGNSYNILTSTNLTLPVASWSVVGSGRVFSGPTFSNSITIDPASPSSFYRIKTL